MKNNFTVVKQLMLLVVLLVTANIATYAQTPEQPADYVEGVGGTVSTLNHLAWLAEQDTVKGYWSLANDIDARATKNWDNGKGFSSIKCLQGTFDGRGFTISNIFIENKSVISGKVAFFKQIMGYSTVKCLSLTDVDITGGMQAAALVLSGGSIIIDSCHISGEVHLALEDEQDYGKVGALTCSSFFCKISNTSVDIDINTPFITKVGGFTSSSSRDTITNCSSTGNIVGSRFVGGFAGYCAASFIENCHSTGNVTGNAAEIGGFVGAGGGTLRFCYATGDVTYNEDDSKYLNGATGGFVGIAYSNNISFCYSTGSVVDITDASRQLGGFAGEISSKAIVSRCYSTSNVSGIGPSGFAASIVSSVDNCFSAGTLTGTNAAYGFSNSGTTTNCYSACSVSRTPSFHPINFRNDGEATYYDADRVSGVSILQKYVNEGLTGAQMASEASFEGWDFANIWEMRVDTTIDERTRPYFREASFIILSIIKEGNGTLEGELEQRLLKSYNVNSEITAVADSGYVFIGWLDENDSILSTEVTLIAENISENTAITALFDLPPYTINCYCGYGNFENNSSKYIAEVRRNHASDSIEVFTKEQYQLTHQFTHWTSNGEFFSNENPLYIDSVTSDLNLIAVYEAKPYTLTDGDVSIKDNVIVACRRSTLPSSNIIIPDTLDGQLVTGIKIIDSDKIEGFDNKNITKITLPSKLESIGTKTFRSNKITAIIIPSSVKEIGFQAFYNNKISHLDLSLCDSLELISESAFERNEIDTIDFSGCSVLAKIEDKAFYINQISAIDLTPCKSLELVGSSAFGKNILESFALPTTSLEYNFDYWEGLDNQQSAKDANPSRRYTAKRTTYYIIEFNINDNTGLPLAEANITVNDTVLVTNSEGYAVVYVPLVATEYAYTVSANGYVSYTDEAVISNGETLAEVSLIPQFYTLIITVNDGEEAIEGASISINDTTYTTNASGEATIGNIAYGNYGYTVTAIGYESINDTILVSEDTNKEVVFSKTAGVEDHFTTGFNIYPNPTSGNFSISCTSNISQIIIFDPMGRAVYSEQLNNATRIAEVKQSNLKKGLYFIRVEVNGTHQVQQLIIK